MEQALSADFADVRVHTGEAAERMGALAFTQGNDVHFARGQYHPGTPAGDDLIGHELVHVIQQRGGRVAGIQGKNASIVEDVGLEAEADELGARAARGEKVAATGIGHASEAVQRKAPATPGAPPQLIVSIEGGKLFTTGSPPLEVGFQDGAGKFFVTVDASGKQRGIPLGSARLGVLRVRNTDRMKEVSSLQGPAPVEPEADLLDVYRMEEVTLQAEGQATAAASGLGGDAAATAAGKSQYKVMSTGKRAGLIEGGVRVLDPVSGWTPVAPDQLPASIKSKLDDSARIELGDGSLWVWMSFALRDEAQASARWVPPGHGRKEVQQVEQRITSESAKLPASSNIKQEVDRYLHIISLVSTVEGGFDATSPQDDTYASLGIFQWAMPKNESGDAGSLGMFFRNLKERAEAASKRPEKERTEEDRLYIAAWKQCTDKKLDVSGKQILLDGKPATGGQVESTLRAEMAAGSLRTYQLVAARDWVELFRAVVVRPGPIGASLLGNGYAERNGAGTDVKLAHGQDTLMLTATTTATVGRLFATEKALAYAVILGVNRPHYVETALWRALDPTGAPMDRCRELLDALFALLRPAGKPGAKAGKTPAAKAFTATEVVAAGPEAEKLYAQLQALVWPDPGGLDEAAGARLVSQFKQQAMKLYAPSDARKYHREQRFSTVDAASW